MDINEMDWHAYVNTMTVLHGIKLNALREAEVVEQMQRLHQLAQRFLEFPLDVHIEPAPVFRP